MAGVEPGPEVLLGQAVSARLAGSRRPGEVEGTVARPENRAVDPAEKRAGNMVGAHVEQPETSVDGGDQFGAGGRIGKNVAGQRFGQGYRDAFHWAARADRTAAV